MKKLPLYLLLTVLAIAGLSACHSEDDATRLANTYAEWYQNNNDWINEMIEKKNDDGTDYYTKIVPSWNTDAYVLIHYFNDRSLTAGNLSPLYTSTVDTRYYATYYNDEPMDSSYLLTTNGPGIFRTKLNAVITGWAIALQTMHVGDTAEIIIPYQQAYGATSYSSVPPFSNLKFNVRLVDIPAYEINPDAI